jgi:hypothetical protein
VAAEWPGRGHARSSCGEAPSLIGDVLAVVHAADEAVSFLGTLCAELAHVLGARGAARERALAGVANCTVKLWPCPPPVREIVSKKIDLPAQRRGDSMRSKLYNKHTIC